MGENWFDQFLRANEDFFFNKIRRSREAVALSVLVRTCSTIAPDTHKSLCSPRLYYALQIWLQSLLIPNTEVKELFCSLSWIRLDCRQSCSLDYSLWIVIRLLAFFDFWPVVFLSVREHKVLLFSSEGIILMAGRLTPRMFSHGLIIFVVKPQIDSKSTRGDCTINSRCSPGRFQPLLSTD